MRLVQCVYLQQIDQLYIEILFLIIGLQLLQSNNNLNNYQMLLQKKLFSSEKANQLLLKIINYKIQNNFQFVFHTINNKKFSIAQDLAILLNRYTAIIGNFQSLPTLPSINRSKESIRQRMKILKQAELEDLQYIYSNKQLNFNEYRYEYKSKRILKIVSEESKQKIQHINNQSDMSNIENYTNDFNSEKVKDCKPGQVLEKCLLEKPRNKNIQKSIKQQGQQIYTKNEKALTIQDVIQLKKYYGFILDKIKIWKYVQNQKFTLYDDILIMRNIFEWSVNIKHSLIKKQQKAIQQRSMQLQNLSLNIIYELKKFMEINFYSDPNSLELTINQDHIKIVPIYFKNIEYTPMLIQNSNYDEQDSRKPQFYSKTKNLYEQSVKR